MKRLAIVTTHPIQYNAPLFAMLAERGIITIKVFYTWGKDGLKKKYDPGFDKTIEWNIPLLEGYEYSFVNNVAEIPGSHHFGGIDNPTLIADIKSWGAHAVLVYGWPFKSHWKLLRYFHGKLPLFFRGDSTLLEEVQGVKQLIRRIALQYIYRHIDKAFYAGTANKDYFLAHGLKENQLIFMPHAVDNTRFSVTPSLATDARQFRAAHYIPDEACVFLFAGKLENKKQPAMLASVFANTPLSNGYLIFAGSGPLEEGMRKLFAGNPRIIFLGFINQKEMPVIYHASDVLVLPSAGPNETWGLCINEAMAAGKAIIASDVCGAAYDLVLEQQNGFIFRKNNPVLLQQQLQFCNDQPEEIKKMGLKSLSIIKQYSIEQDCIAIEDYFNVKGEKNIK